MCLSRDRWQARLTTSVLLLISLFGAGSGRAQDAESIEYKIKAAYLYNFTKFISWPPKDGATFNICIIGADPFGRLLDSLESKTAQDKPIRVYRYDNLKQIKDCQIAYFDKTEPRADPSWSGVLLVGSLEKTLTVGSQAFFAEQGGMIGFVLEDEKVKLHINLKTMKQSGLVISAKLIEVATVITGGERE